MNTQIFLFFAVQKGNFPYLWTIKNAIWGTCALSGVVGWTHSRLSLLAAKNIYCVFSNGCRFYFGGNPPEGKGRAEMYNKKTHTCKYFLPFVHFLVCILSAKRSVLCQSLGDGLSSALPRSSSVPLFPKVAQRSPKGRPKVAHRSSISHPQVTRRSPILTKDS